MHRAPALLGLILLAPASAHAIDLSTSLEIWFQSWTGAGGNTGEDAAHGVAIDSAGNYVIVGVKDGDLDYGTNGFIEKVDNTGAAVWSVEVDAGVIDRVVKFNSSDALYDVAVDSNDDILIGGQLSGNLGDYAQAFHLGKRSGVDGVELWSDNFQDSTGSDTQAAYGVCVDGNDDVYATGWSYRAAFINGQWTSFRYLGTTGARDLGPLYHDFGADLEAPDQGQAMAVDSAGNMIVVGAIGNDGATGSTDADRDWHVRKYDAAGVLLWEDTWAGAAGLDDVATGVAVLSTDEIAVVGYTNLGTDNDAGADFDWLVIKYDAAGLGTSGNRLWELTWESAAGASEQAMDVDVDDLDNLVIGGNWIEAGKQAWRVSVWSEFDGAELSEWAWPSTSGDSTVLGIDVDEDRVAVTGVQHNGVDGDAHLIVLDGDRDGDLVGNSVDGCPDDGDKVEGGVCGCGNPDVDTDGDTVLDCDDACPDNPEKAEDAGVCGCDESDIDTDGDLTPDCIDNCPEDPNKIALGECGCGTPDQDTDGDGVLGCDDACANTPPGQVVDDKGCPPEEDEGPGTTTGDSDGDGASGGCGCSQGPSGLPVGLSALALLALAARRRREH